MKLGIFVDDGPSNFFGNGATAKNSYVSRGGHLKKWPPKPCLST